MDNVLQNVGGGLFSFESPLFIVLALWTLLWKGHALWHSAKRTEPVWFIILLIVNTMGILEIIYLFGVAKIQLKDLFKK